MEFIGFSEETTKRFILWLIWETYNSFPKISKNKTKNRSKNTRPRVLHLILYSVFRYFRKWKTRRRTKFYASACYPTRLCYLLDRLKINCFEGN